MNAPIHFDYGINTVFGLNCYVNYNFYCIDCAKITMGNNVFFGPNVSVVTALHPFLPSERNLYVNKEGVVTDQEYAKPITIEDDCWIAANVTIIGGVHIRKGCIILTDSLVTKDIPAGHIAV